MLAENFAFVMNVASLGGENYTLAPGHVLRRATQEGIAVIKETVKQFSGAGMPFLFWLWERKLPIQSGPIVMLPEREWRYFVIGFSGSNATVEDIQTASDLAALELEIGFTIIEKGGVVLHPGRLFHVVEAARFGEGFSQNVRKTDLEEIMSICSRLKRDDDDLADIKPIANQVRQLKALPHDSPLRFLGYFAVLESLLTHPPKPSDPYDSITRQVKKKIALLDNRWARRIDYTPFGGIEPEAVWAKMYAYRSRVAHGAKADFAGELANLGNHEQALKLIKETVKAIIRQALIEPRLLLDLRDC